MPVCRPQAVAWWKGFLKDLDLDISADREGVLVWCLAGRRGLRGLASVTAAWPGMGWAVFRTKTKRVLDLCPGAMPGLDEGAGNVRYFLDTEAFQSVRERFYGIKQ